MWILKGMLLGVGIFVVGGISYYLICMGFAMYRLVKLVKAGAVTQAQGGGLWDIRGLIYIPVLWLALFASIAVGLWITHRFATR